VPNATLDGIITCPGCGGRNPHGSTECDWCGRSFISPRGRVQITIWQVLSSIFLLGLIGAVVLLAVLNAGRSLPPVRAAAPTATVPPPTVLPTPAVTPRAAAATTSAPTPTLAEPTDAAAAASQATPPEPTAEPTPALEEALIANTSGLGVTVRLQPGTGAQRAGVLREGTKVLLTGNDQTVAARPWREIETEDHNLKGWVLADFLQPAS